MEVGRVHPPGGERRLGQQQVDTLGHGVQARARAGVTGVAHRPAVGGDPQSERRDGMGNRDRLDPERTDLEGAAVAEELELLTHARVERQVVGARHPVGGVRGTPDRDPWLRTVRVVLAHDVEARQVEAVVGMQVAEQHRVDGQRVGVALQIAERPAAQVEDDPPGAALVLGLQQIAAGRGVRSGKRAGAADDGQPHVSPPTNCDADTISGPRKRRPTFSNSSGAPVVRNWYVGSPLARISPVSARRL